MKQGDAKVSVIIPCYNVAAYIDRCVESIIYQDYGMQNLELILIDDRSTDDTIVCIEKIEKKYPDNVIIVGLEENCGPATARNVGFRYASGQYITFMDGDDMMAPGMIRELMRLSCKYDSDVSECSYDVFSDQDKIVCDESGEEHFQKLTNVTERIELLINSLKTAVWGRLYKKDFIIKNKLFFPDGGYNLEDVFFSGLAALYIDRYCKTDKKLYWYYRNSEGLEHSSYNKIRMRNEVNIIDMYINEICVQRRRIDEGQISPELEYYCILHGILAPISKLLHSSEDSDTMMSEAMFLAEHMIKLFPKAFENKYLNRLKDDESKLALRLMRYAGGEIKN